MSTRIPASDAAESAVIVTHWVSADGQGSYDMTGLTAADALRELLGQCGEGEQRDGILAGHFEPAPTAQAL